MGPKKKGKKKGDKKKKAAAAAEPEIPMDENIKQFYLVQMQSVRKKVAE
jgi:hypothetical protein